MSYLVLRLGVIGAVEARRLQQFAQMNVGTLRPRNVIHEISAVLQEEEFHEVFLVRRAELGELVLSTVDVLGPIERR